jgi:hypothetical protein
VQVTRRLKLSGNFRAVVCNLWKVMCRPTYVIIAEATTIEDRSIIRFIKEIQEPSPTHSSAING